MVVEKRKKRKPPALTIRFESRGQLDALREAAKLERRSLNAFIINALAGMTEKAETETAQRQPMEVVSQQ